MAGPGTRRQVRSDAARYKAAAPTPHASHLRFMEASLAIQSRPRRIHLKLPPIFVAGATLGYDALLTPPLLEPRRPELAAACSWQRERTAGIAKGRSGIPAGCGTPQGLTSQRAEVPKWRHHARDWQRCLSRSVWRRF